MYVVLMLFCAFHRLLRCLRFGFSSVIKQADFGGHDLVLSFIRIHAIVYGVNKLNCSQPPPPCRWAVCFAWWQIWMWTAVAAAAWYWRDEPRRLPQGHRLLAATALLRLCRPPTTTSRSIFVFTFGMPTWSNASPVLCQLSWSYPVPHTDVGHVMHCYLMMYIILSVEIASNVSSRLVSTAFKVWILCWWLLSTYYTMLVVTY